MPDSQAPKSKIMQYKELILALAALAAGLGGVFKPADTTATETAYAFHAAQIEVMAENQRALQQDLANLRGFLDGYLAAEDYDEDEDEVDEVEPEPARGRRRASSRRTAVEPEPEAEPPRSHRPALPEMKAKAQTYKKMDFDQLMQAQSPKELPILVAPPPPQPPRQPKLDLP